MSRRLERVQSLLQRVASRVIRREVDLPGDVLATVERVEVSPDLTHAKIFVSIYPEARRAGVERELRQQWSEIAGRIVAAFRMRERPHLELHISEAARRLDRIETLLDDGGAR